MKTGTLVEECEEDCSRQPAAATRKERLAIIQILACLMCLKTRQHGLGHFVQWAAMVDM